MVDAKSGVSGAGRDPKPDLQFGEVNESVKAYGIFTHRHIGEIEQELGALGGGLAANPGVRGVDFLPHLIPMTRGILSAGHVRTTRAVTQAELDDLYHDAYGDEPFVTVTEAAPATKHVLGSNEARVWCRLDERNGPRPRDRRPRQPREGRGRPGDPGVQRRARPARDRRPAPAAARAMTLATDAALEPLPVALPPVERVARLPRGFLAAGATAGIKASGRPDLVLIVAEDGPVPAAAVFTPNRFAAAPVRLSRANLQATGGGDAAAGFARAVVSTSGSANAATGPDGDADQARIGAAVGGGDRCGPSRRCSTSRPGSSAPGCRSTS